MLLCHLSIDLCHFELDAPNVLAGVAGDTEESEAGSVSTKEVCVQGFHFLSTASKPSTCDGLVVLVMMTHTLGVILKADSLERSPQIPPKHIGQHMEGLYFLDALWGVEMCD